HAERTSRSVARRMPAWIPVVASTFGRGVEGHGALASGVRATARRSLHQNTRIRGDTTMHSTIGKTRLAGALAAGLLVCASGAMAQGRTLTAQDYARAEHYMSYNTMPLVDHDVQRVKWLDDTHFWYVDHDAGGDHVMTMDTATGKAA